MQAECTGRPGAYGFTHKCHGSVRDSYMPYRNVMGFKRTTSDKNHSYVAEKARYNVVP